MNIYLKGIMQRITSQQNYLNSHFMKYKPEENVKRAKFAVTELRKDTATPKNTTLEQLYSAEGTGGGDFLVLIKYFIIITNILYVVCSGVTEVVWARRNTTAPGFAS